jgi:hypothetical protein
MSTAPSVYHSRLALTAEDLERYLDFLCALRSLPLCPGCGTKIAMSILHSFRVKELGSSECQRVTCRIRMSCTSMAEV